MLEQTGNSIILYADFNKSGLTDVTVNAWSVTRSGDSTQVLTDIDMDNGVFEIGASGFYAIRIASTTECDYIGRFHTEDPDVDNQDEPSLMMVGRGGVDHLDADVSDAGIGDGDIEWDYTVYTDAAETIPLEGVLVWLTSDEFAVPGPQYSNAQGKTTWRLFAGTYSVWRQKAGYLFSNPDSEVVGA
jgi:hypothetical protein